MRQPTRSSRFQLALRSLEDWLFAAEIEQERLNAEEHWKVDATFFLYALRNLLRSGELAARAAPPQAASDIQRQLEKLKASVPTLVDLRDVLEHFDDYLEMKGKLQHPETPMRKRRPDASIDPWESKKRKRRAPPGSFGFWTARQADDDLLVGAGELELRVDVAMLAARDMATAILEHRSQPRTPARSREPRAGWSSRSLP
jgi:hypothetical protein